MVDPNVNFQDDILLSQFVRAVRKRLKVYLVVLFVVPVAGYVATYFVQPKYTAVATVVLGEGSSSTSDAAKGLLGGGLSLFGLSPTVANKQEMKQLGVLKSRKLREQMVERLNLLPKLFPEKWDEKKQDWVLEKGEKAPTVLAGAGAIGGMMRAESDKKNPQMTSLVVESVDPELAMLLANEWVVDYQNVVTGNKLAVLKRDREFWEARLVQYERNLLEMGKEVSTFYERNTVSPRDSRITVNIPMHQLAVDYRFNNYKQFEEFIASQGNVSDNENVFPVPDVPQNVYLEYMMLKKTMQTELQIFLRKQYEMARMSELRQEPYIDVLDAALLPTSPSKPKRRVIGFVLFAFSFIAVFTHALFTAMTEERARSRYG